MALVQSVRIRAAANHTKYINSTDDQRERKHLMNQNCSDKSVLIKIVLNTKHKKTCEMVGENTL
jgi:hypothetical protein